MKKDLADYLRTRREVEIIMCDEGDRFMYDLSHWPEVVKRFIEYKNAKKKSAMKMVEVQKIINSKEGGKAKVEEIVEEVDSKDKEATAEEVLDIGSKMKTILEQADSQLVNEPITYATELGHEVSNLKKVAFTVIAAELFDIIFLS